MIFKYLLIGILACASNLNVLVDLDHGLPTDYGNGVVPEAQVALTTLVSEAWFDHGIDIRVNSDFRSYYLQAHLYDENPNGRAPAGHSEHQLGTAFDVAGRGMSDWVNDENIQVWTFLRENAHKYGFVISYPYKECDTWPYSNENLPACGVEYRSEPWHIRYVGLDLALEIYRAGYLDPLTTVVPQDFYVPLDTLQKVW